MKTAVIPPTCLLKTRDIGSISFGLCHEIQRDTEYADYYQNLDKFWILDNGADELGSGVQGEELFYLASQMSPSELILPDVLEDFPETVRRSKKFYETYSHRLPCSLRYMGVAQGKTFAEWISCYMMWFRSKGVDTIGIPYDLPFEDIPGFSESMVVRQTNAGRCAARRIALLMHLKENDLLKKTIHLLGSNDIYEFVIIRAVGLDKYIRSTDSTMAFAATANGELLNCLPSQIPSIPTDKKWPKLDFQSSCLKSTTLVVLENLIAYFQATGDAEALSRAEKLRASGE